MIWSHWLALSLWGIAAVFALGLGPLATAAPTWATVRWLVTLATIVLCVITGLVLFAVL